jgi:hypothetical protein
MEPNENTATKNIKNYEQKKLRKTEKKKCVIRPIYNSKF